jgi:antitoxin component of RelBE/YafQ-DinJ toxin-antitoxin module
MVEEIMEEVIQIRIKREDKLKLGLKASQMGLNLSSLLRMLIIQFANEPGTPCLTNTSSEKEPVGQ